MASGRRTQLILEFDRWRIGLAVAPTAESGMEVIPLPSGDVVNTIGGNHGSLGDAVNFGANGEQPSEGCSNSTRGLIV